MNKIFIALMLIATGIVLVACGENSKEDFPIGVLKLTEVRLVSSIQDGLSLSDGSEENRLAFGFQTTSFESIIGSREWLAIYIVQPETVTEQFIVQGIIINMPDGSHDFWTASSVLEDRTMEIRMDIGANRNIIFIPIITNEIAGEYSYSIEQIRYTDANGINYRVNQDAALDSITITLYYPNFYNLNNNPEINYYTTWNIGAYYKNERKFYLSYVGNLENRLIYEIKVNDEVLESYPTGRLVSSDTEFVIPESFEIKTNEWLKVSFSYDEGFAEISVFTGYVVDIMNVQQTTINIYSGYEFGLIDRSSTELIILKADILIDYEFVPFDGVRLNLVGNSFKIDYTFSNQIVLYDRTIVSNQETFVELDSYGNLFSDTDFSVNLRSAEPIVKVYMPIGDQNKVVLEPHMEIIGN